MVLMENFIKKFIGLTPISQKVFHKAETLSSSFYEASIVLIYKLDIV
jgi:hypothetical protein